MKTHFFRSVLAVTILAALGFVPVRAAPWQEKVSPSVLNALGDGEADFLIVLAEQADLSAAASLPDKQAKGEYVYRKLNELAGQTQASLLADLQSAGAEYQPYWVANLIWARGDARLVKSLASRSDVAYLAANPQVQLSLPEERPQVNQVQSPDAIEWNITQVNADDVWAAGYTGQGVVIAGQDTGYDWDHPALIDQYRGWNGAAANHDYNWHDAIHVTGSTCGADSPEPCDDHGHGTHTMGTMVGDDGLGNQVGMAPGARWIGCRNMNSGAGTPQTYTECFQWFVAPTRIDGSDARPDLAPDVINNSWGCPLSEGCDANAVAAMQIVVENVRAAGIMIVASAGNYGVQGCGTVNDPAGIYDAVFSVGATDSNDDIASFSSRGPADYTGLAKPDISAPGVGIRSAQRGGGYFGNQGTSMAAPHVAGEVALLISAFPSLRGDVDTLETLITGSAVPRVTMFCGGTPGGVPNNVYGWGRIDAWGAYRLAQGELMVKKQAPAVVSPEQPISYTLTVSYTGFVTTHGVVLTDVLPLHTTLVTATLPFTQTGDMVFWGLGDLVPHDSRSVELVVLPDAVANLVTNQRYGANSTEMALPVGEAPAVDTRIMDQLALSKQAPAWVSDASPITYTLTITNQRASAFTMPLALTDTLPAYTTFVTATLPYTLTGNVIEWRFATIPPGEARQVNFVVQPDATLAKEIVNDRYGVRSLEIVQTIGGPPVITRVLDRLSLQKQAPAQVKPGDSITYTLWITNNHLTLPSAPLVLTDTIPANTTFVTATLPYTLTGNLIEWNFAGLAPGNALAVSLTVKVPGAFAGIVTNDNYGLRTSEFSFEIIGPPVTTWVARPTFLPVIWR